MFLFFVDVSSEVPTNVTSPEVPTNVTSPFISSDSTVSVETSDGLYRSLPDQCGKMYFLSKTIILENRG